jgi:hypothetical protein
VGKIMAYRVSENLAAKSIELTSQLYVLVSSFGAHAINTLHRPFYDRLQNHRVEAELVPLEGPLVILRNASK